MNKQEFLGQLQKRISGLPQKDIDERLEFYREMVDEQMEDGLSEEDAVSNIGTVEEVAEQIIADIPLGKLVTVKSETNTYEINEAFDRIELNTETADILLTASADNTCRVECYEQENMKHSVDVEDGMLTINTRDDRKWYDYIGINLQPIQLTVYLPKSAYESIKIKESTGDIKLENITVGTMELSDSTGDIEVSEVTCKGKIKINVSTGEVRVMNVTCQNFASSGSTGNLSLMNVNASDKLSIERSTGDVRFDNSDPTDFFVKTSTGDVTGSLLSEKVFITNTSTGRVAVPKTMTGGTCEIITSTGDITIEIAE